MRLSGVSAAAMDVDGELVGRGEERTRPDGEMAGGDARHVVEAVHLLDGEAVHQAVLEHGLAAAAAFLGGLKDHHSRAGEVARFAEITRGAEQHGGVAVMAAGVHEAGILRRVREAGRLGDRQGVHVGAKPDHPAAVALAAADDADHAGAADAGNDFVDAEFAQAFGDDPGRPIDVVEELGMAMNVAAPGGDIVVELGEAVNDRHG